MSVFTVICSTSSILNNYLLDSSASSIKAAVKPLQDDKVHIIPVILGNEASKGEGDDVATSKNDVIVAKDRDSPRRITDAIMDKALSGSCEKLGFKQHVLNKEFYNFQKLMQVVAVSVLLSMNFSYFTYLCL